MRAHKDCVHEKEALILGGGIVDVAASKRKARCSPTRRWIVVDYRRRQG